MMTESQRKAFEDARDEQPFSPAIQRDTDMFLAGCAHQRAVDAQVCTEFAETFSDNPEYVMAAVNIRNEILEQEPTA